MSSPADRVRVVTRCCVAARNAGAIRNVLMKAHCEKQKDPTVVVSAPVLIRRGAALTTTDASSSELLGHVVLDLRDWVEDGGRRSRSFHSQCCGAGSGSPGQCETSMTFAQLERLATELCEERVGLAEQADEQEKDAPKKTP